jgi:hypothetical protein
MAVSEPPRHANTRRDYIIQIYDYFGWAVPQEWRPTATPEPVFSNSEAVGSPDLQGLSFKELAAIAKERNIPSFGVKKEDLLTALKATETPQVERIKVKIK